MRHTRHLTLLVMMVSTFCAADIAAQATAPSSLPAEASETQPASQPASDRAPLSGTSVPPSIAAAMTFSDEEMIILDDVHDRTTQELRTDAALPVLISHVAMIKPLSQSEYNSLDSVSVASLRERPDAFRYRPVRVSLLVYRVWKVSGGQGLRPVRRTDGSLFLPEGTDVWAVQATQRGRRPDVDKEPVTLYTTTDPTLTLGTPDKDEKGIKAYFRGRPLNGAGIFYRVRTGETDQPYDYPVVVLWQMEPGEESSPWTMILVGVAVVGAFLLWLWVRKGLRRRGPIQFKAPTPAPEPDPDEVAAVDPELRKAVTEYQQQAKVPPPPKPVDGEVDPALREAVEQWKREHPEDDNKPQS